MVPTSTARRDRADKGRTRDVNQPTNGCTGDYGQRKGQVVRKATLTAEFDQDYGGQRTDLTVG